MSGLRACLLSGGASRRMGTDKALLPHPAGGTWLTFSLAQLAGLPLPITLFSHHRAHLALARPLRDGLGDGISVLEEPPPREGPLLALERLMHHYPDQDLLLCPVDMPWLATTALQALVATATGATATPCGPAAIHLADDGRRLQPLLGVYPASASRRLGLRAFTAAGGRRLQDWLAGEEVVAVSLPARGLRNANRPDDATALWP
ncbi:molybdenum cofactor guanylyltransferase [Synechococcus sp. BA-132 BA5]|uniref:molybdenum cofactor guanylyltransferase n=1 Tax=Synechococcus sp. BA-132 BA5 TaxID=3110252 RepID=UPI002B1F0268|nr:molybdenum cofactor guanylyltransferase [Synechococcus sp. BA-132 BA5]MEA5414444.1 molybdenum cofactor guanylyltransferase [Synechococcus sp. BA-132 BA5]